MCTYSILRDAKSPMEGGKRPVSMLDDKSLNLETKRVSERPREDERKMRLREEETYSFVSFDNC